MWQGEDDQIFTNFRGNYNIVQILFRRRTSPVIYQIAMEIIKRKLGTLSIMENTRNYFNNESGLIPVPLEMYKYRKLEQSKLRAM